MKTLKATTFLLLGSLIFASSSFAATGSTTKYVNFRATPKVSNNIIASIKPDTQIEILEKVNKYWYKISYKGRIGYIDTSRAVELQVPELPSTGGEIVTDPVVTEPEESTPEVTPIEASTADKIIEDAQSYLGKVTYKYGVNNEGSLTFDCSSFTKFIFGHHNIKLIWSSNKQSTQGTKVEKSDLQKGDLVFFTIGSSKTIGHVGIYIADGKFIHNNPSGGVNIATMNSGYWEKHFVSGARVIK